jgi:uncharacterized protein YbjT (DUF2867 family)
MVGAQVGDKEKIMLLTANNIIAANAPRILFTSSLGLCGSASTIRCVLSCIVGEAQLKDAEAADRAIRETGVPCVVLRPAGLSDDSPKGKYNATDQKGTSFSSLSRGDLARCLADLLQDTTFDSGDGIQVYSA